MKFIEYFPNDTACFEYSNLEYFDYKFDIRKKYWECSEDYLDSIKKYIKNREK